MAGTKNGIRSITLKRMIGESSRRILRAMAATAADAKAEWLEAAICEKEVACLLEAERQDIDAAIHYISAASCFARAGQFVHAVPLLRTALSFSIRDVTRLEVETMLKKWLPKAKKQLRLKPQKAQLA